VGVRYLRHTRADNWNRSALRVLLGACDWWCFRKPFLV
jgi:hypothetical protein